MKLTRFGGAPQASNRDFTIPAWAGGAVISRALRVTMAGRSRAGGELTGLGRRGRAALVDPRVGGKPVGGSVPCRVRDVGNCAGGRAVGADCGAVTIATSVGSSEMWLMSNDRRSGSNNWPDASVRPTARFSSITRTLARPLVSTTPKLSLMLLDRKRPRSMNEAEPCAFRRSDVCRSIRSAPAETNAQGELYCIWPNSCVTLPAYQATSGTQPGATPRTHPPPLL